MSTPKPRYILTAFAQCLAIAASALTTTPAMAQAILPSNESEASTNIEVLASFIVNAEDVNFGILKIPTDPTDIPTAMAQNDVGVRMVCDGGNATPSRMEPPGLVLDASSAKCGVFSVTPPIDGLHFRLAYSVGQLTMGSLFSIEPTYTVYDGSGSSVIEDIGINPPIHRPSDSFAAGSANVPMSFYIGGSLALPTDAPPGEYTGSYQVIATITSASP